MTDWKPTANELSGIYAMFWRLLAVLVGRYGSFPSGHLLTILTTVLLDRADYHPTVSELVDITRLPKSAVSRYVALDIESGFLTEVIDPNDRRRRLLHPTLKSKQEQQWQMDQLIEILELSLRAYSGFGDSKNPAQDLKEILRGASLEDVSGAQTKTDH
ncbi:MAG: MarR family winged helix-turn-helix transcriptional regulator [Gammaproteobacteria bacterium]|nr:MarR family winged helix-turn-helix transcriptional regulator [Gammaproteobacteria bacterium]